VITTSFVRAGLAALVFCGLTARAAQTDSNTYAAPLAPALSLVSPVQPFAGNPQIAYDFLHGNAHVAILGDSLQNGMYGVYPQHWHIDNWTGIVAGQIGAGFVGDSGAFTFPFDQPFIAGQLPYNSNDVGPAGAGVAPGSTYQIQFNAQPVPPSPPGFPPSLTNRVYSVGLTPNQQNTFWNGSQWAGQATGTVHADVLTIANPNGVPAGVLDFNVRLNGPDDVVASTPIVTQSNTTSIQVTHLSFPSKPWDPNQSLVGDFKARDGANFFGSNLAIVGVRYYVDGPGFQLTALSQGGTGVDHFLDAAAFNGGQTLSDYLNLTDTNMAYIWLGQNDAGKYDPVEWKTKMESLISAYKAAKPDMRFVLVSTYDTGNSNLAGYADDLYQIAQSDPSVFYINLFDTAGPFPYLDANYLSDHVHENVAGLTYFADLTNAILEQAAAQVAGEAAVPSAASIPEPTGMLWIVVVGVPLLSRGRSRSRASRIVP
jgi:hypothetical protein